MTEVTKDIINNLPKWLFTAAFFALVVFMIISLFSGTTFKIGGIEFGFSPKSKDSVDEALFYTVIGTVETSDGKPSHEIVISPRYPPLSPSPEGNIVGLKVWKDPLGKFPILYFSHEAYLPLPIDLNDSDKVSMVKDGKDLKIQIKRTMRMHKKLEP